MSTSSIVVDASSGKDVTLARTLTSSVTVANPIGGVQGQRIVLRLTQGGHGANEVTWGSAFRFGLGLAVPILKSDAGKVDLLGFIYDAATSRWVYTARGDHFDKMLPPGPWKARYPCGSWFIPGASDGPLPGKPRGRP